MRHEPQVRDADGVTIVLDFLGPRLWDGGTGLLVQLGPLLHLLDVGDGRVPVLLVEGLDEVEIVDDLGAHSAMAAAHNSDAARAVLERGAHVLDSKGAHASDDDVLPDPVHPGEVVGDAVRHHPAELGHAGHLQAARDPDTVVDGKNHALCAGGEGLLVTQRHDLVATAPGRGDGSHPQHLDATANSVHRERVAQRLDILQDFGRSAVVAVGGRVFLVRGGGGGGA
mmetsp:Transcript_6889/g.10656  ORF Transcript_6889/g.10656 Transcript_6889/m.10656 type:complete len:226 (-) Transcript_6889:1752-2429(-)